MMHLPFDNYVVKAFSASFLLALIMLVLATGLINVFRYGPPLSIPTVLILAAVFFVLSAAFFERYEVGSIVWAMLVSLMGTALLMTVAGGILYFATNNHIPPGDIVSSLALAVIVSMTLLSYLKRSLGDIEY